MVLVALGCASQPAARQQSQSGDALAAPAGWADEPENATSVAPAPAAPSPSSADPPSAPSTAETPAPSPIDLPPDLARPGAGPAPRSRGAAPVGLVRAANDAIRRGQHEKGIQTAKQALRRDERYVPAMVVLAKGYYHLRKYELGGAILDIASEIDDQDAGVHEMRGFLALANDNAPGALASFRRATECDPGRAANWNNLGAEYVRAKNYAQAVPALERAVGLAPDSAQAHLNLGSAYRGSGAYQKAEAAYRRALELRPQYPEANFNLGILYLDAADFPGLDKVGRLSAAVAQFMKYKDARSYRLSKEDPVDGYVEEARKGIERERKRLERERKRTEGAQVQAGQEGGQ